jgi:hypothetical protein
MKKKPFRIHVGFTSTGHDRWRYFNSQTIAANVANNIFSKTGIVVTIEKNIVTQPRH